MIYFLGFLRFLGSLLLAVIVAGVGLATTYALRWTGDLPDYRQLDNLTRSLGAETKVYARDNTPLGKLIPKVGEQAISRTIVTLDEVSPFMIGALISNEDRRFFAHYGLDPNGIARQFQRLARGEDVQGGSTLTNQLVKNTLLLDQYNMARTPDRKFKEWILSMQIERSFTKEEILQNYLNAIYWGDGGPVEIYGIHSAAQAYFRTTPQKLTLAQSVYLTTLVPSAGRYFNYKTTRQVYMKPVLSRMVEDGWITQQQADAAWREPLQPRGWKVQYDQNGNITSAELVDKKAKELKAVTAIRAPHFMGQVEQELVRRFGRDKVYGSGGLRVYTTLDPKIQNAVETASRETKYGRIQGDGQGLPYGSTLAAVIVDPFTSEVLGMVGQKLVGQQPPSDWNNAAQGQRQIGSTIKPLLYTAALAKGASQGLRLYDGPIAIRDIGSPSGWYKPQNFEGKTSYRNMTLREALDRSLNLVTVRVAQYVGLDNFFDKLKLLQIPPNDGTSYAAALGAVETTPVKMAAAYAPFLNGGLYREPRYITRVTTARGEVLYDSSTDTKLPTRVWSPQVAYLGLDLIRGVVNDMDEQQGGLATRARLKNWPVAGKTGTSNGPKDFWFVGTTPLYTGAVWVGKQQGGYMPVNYYSGWVSAPIWRRMMELAHAGQAPRQFPEPPAGIRFVGSPDTAYLPKVNMAALDPNFKQQQTTPNLDELTIPRGPVLRESSFEPQNSNSPRTVMVNLDRVTRRIATEFTPPDRIIQRRVDIDQLPGYAPEQNPEPLSDQMPDPSAVKLVRGGAGAVPNNTGNEKEPTSNE